MNDAVSISRATSVSRASSKHGSSISRSQSLIKKNIAPHDLRPSDIMIERFIAWKAIVKQLIAYFEVSGQILRFELQGERGGAVRQSLLQRSMVTKRKGSSCILRVVIECIVCMFSCAQQLTRSAQLLSCYCTRHDTDTTT